jgi:dTDP-4-amino-4,6-dideoxygalactose transaminase
MEMRMLGANYRLTDMQCALGLSQLKKLDTFLERRRAIVARYNEAFAGVEAFSTPPPDSDDVRSAWHLYAIRLSDELALRRGEIFRALRDAGIGVQVHHIPVHTHPYYAQFGYRMGDYPIAEDIYARSISLPLYPDLSESDQQFIMDTVKRLVV